MRSWAPTISKSLRALRLESIRSKLLAFALLATLIPSLSTGWLSYTQNRLSLNQKIAQELQSVSSQSARELDLWVEDRLHDLNVFASSPEVSDNLEHLPAGATASAPVLGHLNGYLNSVKGRISDYEELMVVDRQGRVVGSSAGQSRPVHLPPDWERDIQGDHPVLGLPYWDQGLGGAIMVAAVPIRLANNNILGAFTAKLSLRGVDSILRRFSPGDSGRVYLIMPQNGRLITSSSSGTRALMQLYLPLNTTKNLLSHEGMPLPYWSYARQNVVGALKTVPKLRWAVVAEIPQEEAYRQVRRLRNATVLIVMSLLVGVGLIAYFLGLYIVRPLDRLTEGAGKVAAGDLAVDLPVVGGGEVGYLTSVFNEMVRRLREGRQELERLSITDGLTGLYNRRHLMERLATEVSRARRAKHGFAVLMVDVDHFKKYNDTHGHLAGDEVLIRMAAILRESTRDVDCAARYGGEEFLVMLPETTLDGGVDAAERLRARLATEEFAGDKITLSIGVAEFPEYGETPEAVIASADAALYRAKREGRDRVVRPPARRRSREMRGPM